MWNEIIKENDIKKLMTEYGFFHDACIKEIKYISGAFVNSDLSMSPFNIDGVLSIIFQRQYENPTVIEMEFCGLKNLHLISSKEGNTCIIYGASLSLNDGLFYWGDSINIEDFQSYKGTWICSDKIRWRNADEYIGNQEIYKSI